MYSSAVLQIPAPEAAKPIIFKGRIAQSITPAVTVARPDLSHCPVSVVQCYRPVTSLLGVLQRLVCVGSSWRRRVQHLNMPAINQQLLPQSCLSIQAEVCIWGVCVFSHCIGWAEIALLGCNSSYPKKKSELGHMCNTPEVPIYLLWQQREPKLRPGVRTAGIFTFSEISWNLDEC